MKKLITLLSAVLITASIWAQSPQKMSYQSVIRDASNTLITNTAVGMQISILQATSIGTAVYVETQTPTTNANGLVSIEIGGGTVVSGTFSAINWANGPYFIKTETDPAGGTTYSITGTSQLLSVPYALYAGNTNWNKNGSSIQNSNTGKVIINSSNSSETLRAISSVTNSYFTFHNSLGYKGYVGIYNGENDMDFGTGGGNAIGKVNLVVAAQPKLTVNSDGTVGIGTTSPSQKLEVNGKIKIGDDTTTPTTGTVRYNTTSNTFEGYTNTGWVSLNSAGSSSTKTINIGAAAFIAVSNNSAFYTNGAMTTISSSTSNEALIAPIILPSGAVISEVKVYLRDNDFSNNLEIKILSSFNSSSAATPIFTLSTSGASTTGQVLTYSTPITINSSYQYSIRITPISSWGTSGDFGIVKVQITYTE